MTGTRADAITGADIVELLRAYGPSSSLRIGTLLARQRRDATAAQLQHVLDELLDAGDIVAVHAPARRWNNNGAGGGYVVYEAT